MRARQPITTGDQPLVSVSLDDPLAGLRLLVNLAWPFDPQRRDEALATFAAPVLHDLKKGDPGPTIVSHSADFENFARARGAPVGQLMRDPEVLRVIEQEAHGYRQRAYAAWETTIFDPAGGMLTLGIAPGEIVIYDELRKVSRDGIRVVGRATVLLAAMHQRHPDLEPSLNRVWAVLEAGRGAQNPHIPNDRADFLKLWKRFQSMAPLYAAVALYMGVTVERGSSIEIGMACFQTTAGLRVLLSWALWFREWATSFTPSRARAPLISEQIAAKLLTSEPSAMPLLQDLTPSQIEAAKSYRAPNLYNN